MRATWVLVLLAAAAGASAQVSVPPELRGWEDWVLRGHETHRCPWLVPGRPSDDGRVCAWPSALELSVEEHGGRFSQRWQAATETWLPLPGNGEHWPEEVTLDGAPATLGRPRGRARAAGRRRGAHRERHLPLDAPAGASAPATGGGAPQPHDRWDAHRHPAAHRRRRDPRRADGARQDDRVELRVFRLLDDELRALLTTQLELSVAGEATRDPPARGVARGVRAERHRGNARRAARPRRHAARAGAPRRIPTDARGARPEPGRRGEARRARPLPGRPMRCGASRRRRPAARRRGRGRKPRRPRAGRRAG